MKLNLKKIREENKSNLTVQFLLTKSKYIGYYDQTVIISFAILKNLEIIIK